MPIVTPKITRVDDKTVRYEMPYSLPRGADSPKYPFAGYLQDRQGGGFVVFGDDIGNEVAIPGYVSLREDALSYLVDYCASFLSGFRSGQAFATEAIEDKVSDVLGLARRSEMEKLAERIDELESQGKDCRFDS